MKKVLIASASLLGLMSVAAAAGQPERPGAFGRDRAAAIQGFQADDTSPGASEWGHIAAERAGDNGQMNRDYRDASGGTPSHGNGEDTTDDDGTDDGGDTVY